MNNDTVSAAAVCASLRPATLVEMIYDMYGELHWKRDGESMMNAAVRELVNNAGEVEARVMLAERGLVVVSSLTVQSV